MPISGYVESVIGIRLTILLGCTFMSGGVLLTYFSIQNSFALLIITYGLMFGIGFGFAYLQPMAVAMRWFPEKKGLAMGII